MWNPSLFDKKRDPGNLLPYNGEAIYYGAIFDEEFSDIVYEKLLRTTIWKNDEWVINNKHYITARKRAWYGEHATWPHELLEMKKKIEDTTKVQYKGVLLNLYEKGDVGLGWHNDEESLEEDSSIASVSLGAERRFDLRHNTTKETVSVVLEHGSLLVMQGVIQNFWKHQVPKSKKIAFPRINLTFRKKLLL